jgi:transcriptional regulator with XRE-family HTH domain
MARRAAATDPSIGERIEARRKMRGWSIRHAASRAGISHTTWMRIEKGEIRTDRYTLTDIATALECSASDLTGHPHPPGDRALEAAHACIPALWRALIETAPDEPPGRSVPSMAELASRAELVNSRRMASDYAAAAQLLPELLIDLHSATYGTDPQTALRLQVDALHNTMLTLRHLGYTVEPALAGERARQAAERLDAPVPLALADWIRAHAAFAAGSYGRARTLTSRAIGALDTHLGQPDAHEVLGMLHLTAAVASLPGDGDHARGRMTEAARIAAHTGESTAWSMGFGPANVAVWRMTLEVDARDPGRAVDVARSVDTDMLSVARAASYRIEMSRALADLRDEDGAVQQLLIAERTAPQLTRSSVAARESARYLLTRSRRASAVFGLCERMGVAD